MCGLLLLVPAWLVEGSEGFILIFLKSEINSPLFFYFPYTNILNSNKNNLSLTNRRLHLSSCGLMIMFHSFIISHLIFYQHKFFRFRRLYRVFVPNYFFTLKLFNFMF